MAAFDTRLEFQRTPGVAGFDAYDVDLVSPELPCGASWLANCLLELGVAVWKPWNLRDADAWQADGARRFRYIDRAEPLRALLPALRYGREFEFRAAPVPRVYHYWPGFYAPVRKTILFVRDPRDALYSTWRRAGTQADGAADFAAFCGQRYFHYPLTFAEYLLLFLRLWRLAVRNSEYLIVRYEDYRRDAAATLSEVSAFLGLDADATALQRAADASSFEAARRDERSAARIQNRAGVAYEFRHAFTPAMHAALGPRYADVCAWLGYEAPAAASADVAAPMRTSLRVAELAEAMRADQAGADAQPKVRALLHAAAAGWAHT